MVSLVSRELDKTKEVAAKYGIGHVTTELDGDVGAAVRQEEAHHRRHVLGLAEPQAGAAQPMYVVYVVGKRPSAAAKRAARAGKG